MWSPPPDPNDIFGLVERNHTAKKWKASQPVFYDFRVYFFSYYIQKHFNTYIALAIRHSRREATLCSLLLATLAFPLYRQVCVSFHGVGLGAAGIFPCTFISSNSDKRALIRQEYSRAIGLNTSLRSLSQKSFKGSVYLFKALCPVNILRS